MSDETDAEPSVLHLVHGPAMQERIVELLEDLLAKAKDGRVSSIAFALVGRASDGEPIWIDGFKVEDYRDALQLGGLCGALVQRLYASGEERCDSR